LYLDFIKIFAVSYKAWSVGRGIIYKLDLDFFLYSNYIWNIKI